MTKQKKAIDMAPEELNILLETLPTAEDTSPCFYFSEPNPYWKCEPLPSDKVRRELLFDSSSGIRVKNLSAYWIPELTVTEKIGGTIYTATGSYAGEENFLCKLERITAKNFTKKFEDGDDKSEKLC